MKTAPETNILLSSQLVYYPFKCTQGTAMLLSLTVSLSLWFIYHFMPIGVLVCPDLSRYSPWWHQSPSINLLLWTKVILAPLQQVENNAVTASTSLVKHFASSFALCVHFHQICHLSEISSTVESHNQI